MKQQTGTKIGAQIFSVPHWDPGFVVLTDNLHTHIDPWAADVLAFDERTCAKINIQAKTELEKDSCN